MNDLEIKDALKERNLARAKLQKNTLAWVSQYFSSYTKPVTLGMANKVFGHQARKLKLGTVREYFDYLVEQEVLYKDLSLRGATVYFLYEEIKPILDSGKYGSFMKELDEDKRREELERARSRKAD